MIGCLSHMVSVVIGGQTIPWAKTDIHAPGPVADDMVVRVCSVVRCEHDDGSC